MAAEPESLDEINQRRRRRTAAIWVIVVVFVLGNVADLLGLVPWGPRLAEQKQRPWILASAAMFWVALSMFLLCIRDLVSVWRHRSRPPIVEDLEAARHAAGYVEIEKTTGFEWAWNGARRWASKHHAIVGLIGFFLGALLGHLFWKVGNY